MSRRKRFDSRFESNCNCFIFNMISSAISDYVNFENAEADREQQRDISDQNYNFQREQFDYQKQLNDLQMEREDTAFQRQVDDAQKVGINPMSLASGSGASSSALQSAPAPQKTAPTAPYQFRGLDMSSLDNIPQLLMNVDQWKNQRDSIRSQMANDEVNRAISLYKAGLKYDDKGKIVPFESDSPEYKLNKENARQQERRNEYYGNLPDNLPNYPAVMTYFSRALSDPSETQKFVDALKNISGALGEIKNNPSGQHADSGKIGETLLNLWENSPGGKQIIEDLNNKRAEREAKRLQKIYKKQSKEESKQYRKYAFGSLRYRNRFYNDYINTQINKHQNQ